MIKAFRVFAAMVALAVIITACGGAATPVVPAATEAGGAEATSAPEATEAPAATEPAGAATEATAGGGELNIRLVNDPTVADPAKWIGAEEPIMLSVYEGLVSYKPGTWEVVNTLAETITPSEDGLSIDFKLKEGIQFHHGYGEVTAEDVKFSYERIAGLTEPVVDSPYKGDWVALDHVEVTGKYTGTIVMKEPFAALWTTTLPQSSGFVLSQKAVEEAGDGYGTRLVVGTGPYQLDEWVQNERYTVSKFADYGGQNFDYAAPVEFDTINFLTINDDSAAAIGLETGEIDFGQIGNADIDRLDALETVDVDSRDTIDFRWVGINLQNPDLQDINVRLAIRYGIDVPAILEAAWENRWARACSIIAPGQVGYWADAPCYDRDVEKAKDYLAEAGAEGLHLVMRVGSNEDDRIIAEIVQANLNEVGFDVEIEQLDDAAMTDAHFGHEALARAQLFNIGFITNPDPSWSTVWFLCEQVEVWNWMEWCNQEFDDLHFAALKETDPEKRAEMYIQMQKLWDEAAHTVWLAYPTLYFGYQTDLEPSLMPHGRILAWNFHSK